MISAWLGRRRYRKAVETNLWWLLVTMPEQNFNWVLKAYPGIRSAADDGFRRGESTEEVSVRVAASVLVDIFENRMSHQNRAAVLAAVRRHAGLEDGTNDNASVERWAKVIATLETQAYRWSELGKIEPHSHDILISEALGALQGLDSEERSRNRVLGALRKALFHRGPDQAPNIV